MPLQSISWWSTFLGQEESLAAAQSIENRHISQGPLTQLLEQKIARQVDVQYCVVVPSGSMGLLLSMLAIGVSPGDQVIVPAATWVATAHAAALLGAEVVLVDCVGDQPLMDVDAAMSAVTPKTKAIIPVHLAGRAADIESLYQFAHERGIYVVEDAAQAFSSRNKRGFLGAQSDMGVFSFGLAKLLSTGQGGAVVTNDKTIYEKLSCCAVHGVGTQPVEQYRMLGMNMKFTDILAAVGLKQLERLEEKRQHVLEVYSRYAGQLSDQVQVMPCNKGVGEIPLWTEVRCAQRDKLRSYLHDHGIETRLPHKPLYRAGYLKTKSDHSVFQNAERHFAEMLVLPSGPSQSIENIDRVIEVANRFGK